MAGDLDNLWGRLEALPIETDTLAALVEGDLRPDEAEALREQLLEADADLAHAVEMMCQDRVIVRTLGDERPPAGMAEVVIARLEREALLGLSDGATTAAIPTSRVRTVSTSRWTGVGRWVTSPAGAGLAMAAVLALAIGVTLQVLPNSTAPETLDTDEVGPLAIDDPVDRMTEPAPARSETAVLGDPPADPRSLALAEADDAAEPAEPVLFRGELDRALALLEEGRLLVRVRSADPTATADQLARLTSRTGRSGEAWRLDEQVTGPVAAAMQQKFRPLVLETQPTVFADSAGNTAPEGAERRQSAPKPSPLTAVYLADTRADRAAVASLSTALSLGDGRVAVFEELPEPLDLPRVLTPESVLWWGRPADEWGARAYLPVVIERVEQ